MTIQNVEYMGMLQEPAAKAKDLHTPLIRELVEALPPEAEWALNPEDDSNFYGDNDGSINWQNYGVLFEGNFMVVSYDDECDVRYKPGTEWGHIVEATLSIMQKHADLQADKSGDARCAIILDD